MRCIVSSLTEDSNSELIDELIKGQPLSADDSYRIDNTQLDAWQDWNPDPVDADPGERISVERFVNMLFDHRTQQNCLHNNHELIFN